MSFRPYARFRPAALSRAAAQPVSPPARLRPDRRDPLARWRSSRRGSTASRRGKISGDAVVNDGDSITLKGERIRLRGIDAPEYNQTCLQGRRDLSVRPPLARGAGRASPGAARSNARAGSATATAACSASARPAGSISTGGRWRRAGRSPMATMPTPSRPRASAAPACGPGRSSGRATGASSMAGWSRANTICSPRLLNWLRAIFGFS